MFSPQQMEWIINSPLSIADCTSSPSFEEDDVDFNDDEIDLSDPRYECANARPNSACVSSGGDILRRKLDTAEARFPLPSPLIVVATLTLSSLKSMNRHPE